MDAADYVLARFRKDELELIDSAITRAASAVELWSSSGIDAAMNKYNADPADESP
jgi:PTH1 family peptidyl-tRNA hydrolase